MPGRLCDIIPPERPPSGGSRGGGMAVAGRRMSFGKRYSPPGSAPGTLRAPETPGAGPVRVTVMDYGPERLIEKEVHSVKELAPYRDTPTVTWINVEGLNNVPFLEGLGNLFGFHPLTLEDVLNCGQRPKLEDYGKYHFLVMKSLLLRDDQLQIEQISFFLSGNYVITLQEVPGDSFEAVRQRIRQTKGQIRKMGPDYLLYALIDALMDEFFPVLERYGERIEELEIILLDRPSSATLQEIHRVKRELLMLRRVAWPEREVINALQREDSRVIR